MVASYSSLTSGSLRLNESKIVAEFLRKDVAISKIKEKIIEDNLFQVKSNATTKKYLSIILPRLKKLNKQQLGFICDGDEIVAKLTLFVAILKDSRLLTDFIKETVIDKISIGEKSISPLDWDLFVEEISEIALDIESWSEKTKAKNRQVAFKILAETGFIDSTKEKNIQFPYIPPELIESLSYNGDKGIISLLKLERQ